jgi:hypothetical protein
MLVACSCRFPQPPRAARFYGKEYVALLHLATAAAARVLNELVKPEKREDASA